MGMTSGPIEWDGCLASLLAEAECDRLVCGQLKIELCDITVYHLLHLLDYPYWQCKCKVESHWQLDHSTSSDVVLTTYSSTSSDGNSLSTAVYQSNAREVSFFIKEIACKLVPVGTSSMLVQYIILYLGCIQAALRWLNASILPSSSQLNISLHGGYTQIAVLKFRCLKYAIVDPLIYTHVCRNRNDDWNRLGIWAVQCQLSDYPSILVRVVSEGKFHLFFTFQYRSNIKFIPLGGHCLLVCTLVPIK